MLKKLLLNKTKILGLIFYFFIVEVGMCSYTEILFLPYSSEETVFMQNIQVLSEGDTSLGNNPAGCAMENKKSLSLSYTNFQTKESLYSIGLFLPKNFANIGFRLRYANLGETELVSEQLIDVRKEKLYSTIFNLSFSKEIFLAGLFLGTDFGLGNIKLDKNLNLISSRVGSIYIFNFSSTELHLGSILGINFCDKESLLIYGFGIKYFVPEYKTFLNISYNKNVYSFITTSIEIEAIKDFVLILGYETSNEKSLTNYSLGIKLGQKNFDIVFGVRYNQELAWTTGISLMLKLGRKKL
ncbi:MAG: hypothetical protein ACK4WJ_01675 [Endomicrobiia bacterium]